MKKSIALLFVFFLGSAFKCSFVESSKSTPKDTNAPSQASEPAPPRSATEVSTKVKGPLRVVISGGITYGEIKFITESKVMFKTIDYGQGEPEQHDVELPVQDGLIMDEKGEISVPVMVFVDVPGGKFPCSSMIAHDPKTKFCSHLLLETDDIFSEKLAKDPEFRARFGAMIGINYDADVKNPYFKVGDVP